MAFPLDQILNTLDQECQGRILIFLEKSRNPFFKSLPAIGKCLTRALFLKRGAPTRPNCREIRGLGLRLKRLTFCENPFSIATIQLGLPSYADSHVCVQQPVLTRGDKLQTAGEWEESASEGSARCLENYGHCRPKAKGFGPP